MSSFIFKPSYQIHNKPFAMLEWPANAGLLITKLPATTKEGYSKGFMALLANRAFYSLDNNSLAFIIVSSYKEEKTRPFEVIEQWLQPVLNLLTLLCGLRTSIYLHRGTKD